MDLEAAMRMNKSSSPLLNYIYLKMGNTII